MVHYVMSDVSCDVYTRAKLESTFCTRNVRYFFIRPCGEYDFECALLTERTENRTFRTECGIVHFEICLGKEIFDPCDNLRPSETRVESYTSRKSPSRTCIKPYSFIRRVEITIFFIIEHF